MVEAGGDLDQALHEPALFTFELTPHIFPELVRLEETPLIERRPPGGQPLGQRRGGTVEGRHERHDGGACSGCVLGPTRESAVRSCSRRRRSWPGGDRP